MLPKALVIMLLIAVITLREKGDTSMQDINLQLVTVGYLQEIINRIIDNN